jgi:hypothetical protein
MKITKFLMGLSLLFFYPCSWATQCVLTLVKDSCWTDYQVNVQFTDKLSNKLVTTVNIPANQNWSRVKFNCAAGQVLAGVATFSPIIFSSEKNNTYSGVRFWHLPQTVPEAGVIWSLQICFGSDFANLPFPPKATGNCKCDTSLIPPVQNE